MVKMQIDLSDDEGKIVEVFKLMNNHKTKQDAIKAMIRYFQVEIKPLKVKDTEYFR